MYAVIFRAKVREFDQEYSQLAEQLRDKALADYGCSEFVAVTEGDQEIAVSYWPSLEHIKKWKADSQHMAAQQKGRQRWYQNYQIEIVKIERAYQG